MFLFLTFNENVFENLKNIYMNKKSVKLIEKNKSSVSAKKKVFKNILLSRVFFLLPYTYTSKKVLCSLWLSSCMSDKWRHKASLPKLMLALDHQLKSFFFVCVCHKIPSIFTNQIIQVFIIKKSANYNLPTYNNMCL